MTKRNDILSVRLTGNDEVVTKKKKALLKLARDLGFIGQRGASPSNLIDAVADSLLVDYENTKATIEAAVWREA